jgi:hypothetical protein
MSYACGCQPQLEDRFSPTYLADQLHVTVLDTVVDHLDVVAGTLVTDPLAAGLAVRLGRDGLEDVFDVRPRLLVSTRHDARTVASTLLSSGHTSTDEPDALAGEVFRAAVRVGVVGVAAVDDDVALLDAALVQEELDEVVDGLASHDEHHHAAGLLELGDELLDGVGANDGLALGLCSKLAMCQRQCSRTVPSFKKRSTLATLFLLVRAPSPWAAPYVRLNATTCNALVLARTFCCISIQ